MAATIVPPFCSDSPFSGGFSGMANQAYLEKVAAEACRPFRQLGSTESSSRRVEGVIELGYALASSTLTLLLGSPRFRERTDLSVNANRQDGQH
jgi:hypothetical protein